MNINYPGFKQLYIHKKYSKGILNTGVLFAQEGTIIIGGKK